MYDQGTPPPSSGDGVVDWTALVPRMIFPTKLLIIEALQRIDRPMSAVEFEHVFDKSLGLSTISYHLTTLAKLGVLREVRKRKVRGTQERFYFFTAAVSSRVRA